MVKQNAQRTITGYARPCFKSASPAHDINKRIAPSAFQVKTQSLTWPSQGLWEGSPTTPAPGAAPSARFLLRSGRSRADAVSSDGIDMVGGYSV